MARRTRVVISPLDEEDGMVTPVRGPYRLRRLRRRLFEDSAEETSSEASEAISTDRTPTWTEAKRVRFDEIIYLLGEIREQRALFDEQDLLFNELTRIVVDLTQELIQLFRE